MQIDDIVIHPVKGKNEKTIPETGIVFVTPQDWAEVKKCLDNSSFSRRFLYNSNMYVKSDNSLFVAGPALGAPMAVLVCEKLIALGCRKLVVCGWCAALGECSESFSIGDIVFCNRAVSGEGTSAYYTDRESVSLDDGLTAQLRKELLTAGIECTVKGDDTVIWSTDAPYRESRHHIGNLQQKHGITHIDMETSALASVALFRGCKLAAVMVVSDCIGRNRWQPGFKKSRFVDNRKALLQALLQLCL